MRRSPTEILLDEWGTSGRKRATVKDLLELLQKVQLYRAADFVATDILNSTPPKRPEMGPAARFDISMPTETYDKKAVEELLNNAVEYPDSSRLVGFKNLDSMINNNNFNFSNSISVDHIKPISFPNSSEEYTSESDSHSDLIEFSARTISSNSNNNAINQQSYQTPSTVFSTRSQSINVRSELPINDDSSSMIDATEDSASEWSADYNFPKLPATINSSISNISSIESKIFSKQFSHSMSDCQVNSSLIPDIDNLKIRNDTNSASALSVSGNVETDSTEVHNESYMPILSLLNGKS